MTNQALELKDLTKVLKDANRIIEHHDELMLAKGDHFNLFTILDIETKENKTHSAFLAELLNPNGSHGLGDVFLKLFLTTINHNEKSDIVEDEKFQTSRAFVRVEHSIGIINLCDKENEDPSKATGGRIDIYLEDKNRNALSIENKIHASDQKAQIQRYYNHKKSRNTVYYLTLMGEEPSDFSKLKLESGVHFYNISYRDDILAWLELSLKEVSNFTSLREAINQYILLIKKLTNTLDTKNEQDLFEAMMDNLEASKYIADNYHKLANRIRKKFRHDVKTKLQTVLDLNRYSVTIGKPIDNSFAQLWINYLGTTNLKLRYGIEPFSAKGIKNGRMFVGICGTQMLPKTFDTIELNRFNKYWQHAELLYTADGNNLNLNSSVLLKRINDDKIKEKKKYEELLDVVVKQVHAFIKDTEGQLGFV